jgi:hypothetical protein
MYYLRNSHLTVTVLDPVRDQARLGPRFCTGGYIYQVEDTRHGPLLSGPEFPTEYPAVVNGQGLPKVFQFTLYHDEREIENKKLIIGVGMVDKRDSRLPYHLFTNSRVLSFCVWQVMQTSDLLRMETSQEYKEWALRLTKEVSLTDRTIRCTSKIHNTGTAAVPFRWFAHPFFPLTANWRCCKVSVPLRFPENSGFALDAEGFITMKRAYNWREGCYHLFEYVDNVRLIVTQHHPQLDRVQVTCDFPLSKLAIWANDKTFSVEPFYQDTILVNQQKTWAIGYEF